MKLATPTLLTSFVTFPTEKATNINYVQFLKGKK